MRQAGSCQPLAAAGSRRLRAAVAVLAAAAQAGVGAGVVTAAAAAADPGPAIVFDPATGGIAAPLTDRPGDVARGREIVTSRQTGLCLLCHQAPTPEAPQQGSLSTDLAGAGSRWTAAQLRARIVDAKRLNPDTAMPAYFRADSAGLVRVGSAWAGRTALSAQQVEDVVAYLGTLK